MGGGGGGISQYSTVNPDGVQLYVQLYSMFTFGMVNVT